MSRQKRRRPRPIFQNDQWEVTRWGIEARRQADLAANPTAAATEFQRFETPLNFNNPEMQRSWSSWPGR